MSLDGIADNGTKSHWDRVTNQTSNPLETVFAIGLDESIVLGKRLEYCTFPQRNRTVLFWMSESPIAEAEKLCRHGRGRFVPFHATVHARVGFPFFLTMALSNQFLWPFSPRSSWR